MSKHYVVSLTFPKGPPLPEEREAQQQFLSGLLDEGRLLLAGVFTDDQGGGMSLLRADSLEAAQEVFVESPLVKADRVEWSLRELKVTWGAK